VQNFDPATSFVGDIAKYYDLTLRGDEEETVALLAELAGDGSALELAIGTGRIGLPLAAAGVSVAGVEISEDMVAQLRAKPGADQIPVTIGDFATVPVEGSFGLIYLVFNTFHNLVTQDDQVRCFENVARHLTDDGCFLIEACTHRSLSLDDHDQYVHTEGIGLDWVHLDVARFDASTQMLDENHVYITSNGVRFTPIVTRQVPPTELDLMARLAGLRLKERWRGWKKEPFVSVSTRHISVYGR
jgi:SAM-dependent methyltransferase